jgi:hypothetical protein
VKLRNWDSKSTTPARSSMASYEDMDDNDYSRLSDFDTHKSVGRDSVDTYSSELSSEGDDKEHAQLPPRRSRIAAIAEINDPLEDKTQRATEFPSNEVLQNSSRGHRPRNRSQQSTSAPVDELTPTERRLSAVNKYQSKYPRSVRRQSGVAIQIGTIQQGSSSSNNSSGYNTSSTRARYSMDSTSDSDYGYATIRKIKTVQTLEERRQKSKNKEKPLKIGLPATCFTPITFRYLSHNSGNNDLFQTKKYLSSNAFMDHFNNLFVDELGRDLGFAPTYINNATVCGATITCQTTSLKLDIIPTIHCSQWPEKALEWLLRSRSRALDHRTNKIYVWPTVEMISRTRDSGCHLVPLGYAPRKGDNPNLYLEWTIEFPEAEKYLETCLNHSQMRCYMFCLMIFQAFLHTPDGLTENHLRHIIFWQAEAMTLTWANCEMYNNIQAVLGYMYSVLSKQCLPNYFMNKKNEFQSIPRGKMHIVQSHVHNFRENPFGHMLAVLKSIKFPDNPYPVLDYDSLLRILRANLDVELINPSLIAMASPAPVVEKNKKASDTDSEGFWGDLKRSSHDPQRLWNERYHKQVTEEKKLLEAMKKNQQRQSQSETIQGRTKVEINLAKFQPSAIRRRLILELFIEHFIKLIRKSLELRLRSQAREYLTHTQNLCTLLGENGGGVEEAKQSEFRTQLDELTDALHHMPPNQAQALAASPTAIATMKPRRERKPLELPKNADLYNELPLTETAIIENWHMQCSDYSETQSTDVEYWRGSINYLRNASRTTTVLSDDDGDNTDL